MQSAALASLFGPGAWFYTLAAGLTQPIFDGFLLESQLKQAKGVQLQNLQAYRKAVLSAFADVEKALVALAEIHAAGAAAERGRDRLAQGVRRRRKPSCAAAPST